MEILFADATVEILRQYDGIFVVSSTGGNFCRDPWLSVGPAIHTPPGNPAYQPKTLGVRVRDEVEFAELIELVRQAKGGLASPYNSPVLEVG